MTRRRWIADRWDEHTATLEGEGSMHLARVLRAQPGMRFDVVAGERVWEAVVASVAEDRVRFDLVAELDAERALPLTLLLSVFKFDRLEWAIEKVTELGVARVVPVLARRTEKHLAQASIARAERWRRIAQEAAKQSRRADLPVIDVPLGLKEAVAAVPEAARLLLSEHEKTRGLADAVAGLLAGSHAAAGSRDIAMAVGPEGGWTEAEAALFAGAGWQSVTLGARILRAETAAIAATAVVSALLG